MVHVGSRRRMTQTLCKRAAKWCRFIFVGEAVLGVWVERQNRDIADIDICPMLAAAL
jgi:hypothetical protein